MNNRQAIYIVPTLLLLMLLLVLMYNSQFGFLPSDTKGDWGTFGDYFGGILNPVIGMLGFIGILRSLRMQQLPLNTMKRDKIAEEVLEAVKDIDKRINDNLVSSVGLVKTTAPPIRDIELSCRTWSRKASEVQRSLGIHRVTPTS